jgi:hypothetical protein
MTSECLCEQLLPFCHRNAGQANQEDAMEWKALAKNHLAKSPVSRDEDGRLLSREFQD